MKCFYFINSIIAEMKGSNCFIFLISFLPPVSKEKRLLWQVEILSLELRSYFERAALARKANRKSQKLFPFVKMIENHGDVPIHLMCS